jgi:large subunit ribosomal protein L31
MKKESHPPYQPVLFIDSASGHRFVCGSTMQPQAKEKFEGVEYPVVYLSISSTSHPFFTGSKQLVDSEGRVEKFKKRFGRKEEVVKDESNEQGSEDQSQEKAPEEKSVAKKASPKKTAKPGKK